MPAEDALDIERLTYAWQSGEDYDSNALSQPWESSEIPVAWNDVGNGWACRIGNVILSEQSAGTRHADVYETAAEAEADWPRFEQAYGGGAQREILNPPTRDSLGDMEL